MNDTCENSNRAHNLPKIIFSFTALVLSVEPTIWLVNTWLDPSYDSHGLAIFYVCFFLFLWSVSSKQISNTPINFKIPVFLLGLSAFARLLGQLYAVNFIGAFTLVLDVFAIALLSGLNLRKRPLSPGWFAAFFAFSLPLERVLQRVFGYNLQAISADGACVILDTLLNNVSCHGVSILINQQNVLIDLPCSGARTALLLQLFYSASMAVCRPKMVKGLCGVLVTLIVGLITNVIRIVFFALNISFPKFFLGIDIMSDPWHDLAGLFFLTLGCLPIVYYSLNAYQPNHHHNRLFQSNYFSLPVKSLKKSGRISETKNYWSLLQSLACLCLAFLIVNLPKYPLDVSKNNLPLNIPMWIKGSKAEIVPLLPKEDAYFKKYGGSATKADYGMHSLLLVKTSSPLRHLHSPDECLKGLGFKVRYKGIIDSPIPSSIYRAISQDNLNYRVAVSFISDQGILTSNISEAIWYWFKNPKSEWLSVQRISPWNIDTRQYKEWDEAIFTALDINNQFHQINKYKIRNIQ